MNSNQAEVSDVSSVVPAVSGITGYKSNSRGSNWQRYANIVRELAIVDFRKKYHDSSLGYFWSMLNPLLRFMVYHFVFSYLFIVQVPKFTLYLLMGVFFWNFFQDATLSAISALRGRARLTKKIYFPRYLLVLSSTLTALFSFAINTFLIVLVVLIFDHVSPLQFLSIIPFVLLVLLSAGIGMILAISFIHFRDISEIWSVIIMLGFWLTPIMYDPSKVPGPLETVALFNPIGRILIMLRAYLLFDKTLPYTFLISTSLLCVIVFFFGLWLFRRYESRIPEYL